MSPVSQNRILLLGFDFGSTTCSAMLLSVSMLSKQHEHQPNYSDARILYRSTPAFTPFNEHQINEKRFAQLIFSWLTEANVDIQSLFSASVIITGLAALKENVDTIRQLILSLLPKALIVTADDPHLESWLAFKGCCAALSRFHHTLPILHFDIGGGTTNSALAINGQVTATGCHYIGARHFQFVPGTYQIMSISDFGQTILNNFNIQKNVNDTLNEQERAMIIAFYVAALEAIARNDHSFFEASLAKKHVQTDVHVPSKLYITFSGGVGDLIYAHSQGKTMPSTTYFGDFGIDLARAIVASGTLSKDLSTLTPENNGPATLYGLTMHSTEVSGNSIYLPSAQLLPLHDIPILTKLHFNAPKIAWLQALQLVNASVSNACLQISFIESNKPKLQQIIEIANLISHEMIRLCITKILVLLIDFNIGKTLGNYITKWGKLGIQLIIIDEIKMRDAHFLNLGELKQGVVPVSFYGMYSSQSI